MLDKDSFQLVDELFDAVLDLGAEKRQEYLEQNCPNDEVRSHVVQLLQSLESAELSPGGAISGAFGESLRREIESDSSIELGTVLGAYRIEGLLGAGGMGEVYRAQDTKLRRSVAIKVLPEDMVAPEQLERFDREARALAAVNHPHIGAIYGLERAGDRPFLVLELIPGLTLSERLQRSPLPLRSAVAFAHQIAGALEAAHAAGIVHRDLKPANIKLADDSQIKVLDFGLAKTDLQGGIHADDETAVAATRTGVILGTAGYMSPEQARGGSVDRRADNWAFGCVLFEMLTGRRLFQGSTPSDTLAAVLREEPPWHELPPATPDGVRRLLRRCLTKDVNRRLQHIGDARVELEDWLEFGEDELPVPAPASSWPRLVPWILAASALALAAWFGLRQPETSISTAQSAVLQVLPPPGYEFWNHYSKVVEVSPDGTRLAYVATDSGGEERLFLRRLDSLESIAVEDSKGAFGPFFSPDGEWVGFMASRQMMKVPVAGGTPLRIGEVGGNSRGAAWADGYIVFAQTQTTALLRIDEDGGAISELTTLDPERVEGSHRWPQMVGDNAVLFTAQSVGAFFDDASIDIQNLDSGERKTLVSRAGFGRVLPNGQLAFVRAGRLYTVEFDASTWEVGGTPRLVLEGLAYDPRNGGAQFSVANDGTMVFRPGARVVEESLPVEVDGRGNVTPYGGKMRVYNTARWSPDGDRLAASVVSAQAEDIWLIERGSSTMTRLTYDGGVRPVWNADGDFLVYAGGDAGALDIFAVAVDRGRQGVKLVSGPNIQLPVSWTPDGRHVLYQERHPERGWDLMSQEVEIRSGEVVAIGDPACVQCTPFHEAEARLSADGRLIAYESDELDNVYQIYVQAYPEMGRKWQLSANGARRPIFGTDSDYVYYWNTQNQGLHGHRVSLEGSDLQVGPNEVLLRRGVDLWQAGTRGDPGSSGFGVSDGGGFLMLQPDEPDAPEGFRANDVVVVLDWLSTLHSDSSPSGEP